MNILLTQQFRVINDLVYLKAGGKAEGDNSRRSLTHWKKRPTLCETHYHSTFLQDGDYNYKYKKDI